MKLFECGMSSSKSALEANEIQKQKERDEWKEYLKKEVKERAIRK